MTLGELKRRAQFAKVQSLLHDFFQDPIKVSYWLYTPNPMLGGTPIVMISVGRGRKLLKFIKQSLAENEPGF